MRRPLLEFLLVLVSSAVFGEALRICTRRHFALVGSHFFQRVELPKPELCVERCIEHLVYCRAAQYTSFSNRTNGLCELHAVNSGTKPGSLHPDANIEPLSTVYELLETCPTFVASNMESKISEKMRETLEKDKEHIIDERRADDSFMREDRVFGQESMAYERSRGVALMRSLDDDPKNPFGEDERHEERVRPLSSSSSPSPSAHPHRVDEYVSSSSARPLPPPILPAVVLHQGRCEGPSCPLDAAHPPQSRDLGQTVITRTESRTEDRYQAPRDRYEPLERGERVDGRHDEYRSGGHVSDDYVGRYALASDRSPCPARRGDPCAPRPPCMPNCPAPVRQPIHEPPVGTWTEWTTCSVSCGEGVRTRSCLGEGCLGPTTTPCYPPCPKWAEWGLWTLCSVSCGEGERRRNRFCLGSGCEGPSQEMERCSAPSCPSWTEWGAWEGCSATCGFAKDRRFRRCENGIACPGSPVEERLCNLPECPRLGPWTEWTPCTVSCGVGETTRTRHCIGNGLCEGGEPTEERLLCNQQRCPEWTSWTAWTTCDACGEKESPRIRNRVCLYEGRPHNSCSGPAQDQSPCPQADCPLWSDWTDWSECSHPCGQGNQKRRRVCTLHGKASNQCRGPAEELRFCQIAVCPYWREWGEWSGCSTTCGIGTCSRSRKCVTDELLDIPNLAELEAAVAEDEAADNRREGDRREGGGRGREERRGSPRNRDDDRWSRDMKADLIARSKRILHAGHDGIFPEVRRHEANGPSILETAGKCDGPAEDHKPCDPGPCCGWREWSEWGQCDGCRMGSLQFRNRQCSSVSGIDTFVSDRVQGHRGTPYRPMLPGVMYQTDALARSAQHTQQRAEPILRPIHGTEQEMRPVHGTGSSPFGHGTGTAPIAPRPSPVVGAAQPGVITARGIVDLKGLTPIIAINDPRHPSHRFKRRVSIYSERDQCQCPGPSEESRSCPATCAAPQVAPCTWTEWDAWCGCSPCRPGREIRRRYCERPHQQGYVRGGGDRCACPGPSEEERDCPVCGQYPVSSPLVSAHRLDNYVPISTAVVVRPVNEHQQVGVPPRNSYASSTRPPYNQRQVDRERDRGQGHRQGDQMEVETSTLIKDYVDYSDRLLQQREREKAEREREREKAQPRDYTAFTRRDTPFPSSDATTPYSEDICRWSRWSGWSACDYRMKLKQRSRFCIGADAPVSACSCMGLSIEETACDPEREGPQSIDVSTTEGSGEQALETFEDTLEESTPARASASPTHHESPSETESCEWTPWSHWSACTVSCGRGERIRKKRCPCGGNLCGGGVTLESEVCELRNCPKEDDFRTRRRSPRKELPEFS